MKGRWLMAMTLNEDELRTVLAVFEECLQLGYPKLNKFMGSLTIMDMMELNGKIRHRKYCARHKIKYEDMTAEDFERAYFEENGI